MNRLVKIAGHGPICYVRHAMQDINTIILNLSIQLPGFLIAIVFHEAAHAYAAYKFGDHTSKYLGRMTLNPVAHIDPIGTILFPMIGIIFGSIMFGWAKPVPIDPRYFKNARKATFWVSFAGPLANILLCVVMAFAAALVVTKVPSTFYLFEQMKDILLQAVYINIVLAVFNLLPFPPLDGSKMVESFLSYENAMRFEALGRYSFIFFIVLIMTNFFSYVVRPFLIMGQALIGIFYTMLV